MLSISPSLSVSSDPTTVPSLPSVSQCCMSVYLAGERGPAGEQASTVTAVFIGTQVSSGALGSPDNALSPRSPL